MAPTKINKNKNNKEDYDRAGEDEISRVLYQFQPIPEFVLVGTKSPKSSSSSSPTNNNNKNNSSGTSRGTTTKRFSSVRYYRNRNNKPSGGGEGEGGGILKLTYQWDPATVIEFEVTTTRPYRVACVSSNSSIREQLSTLCSQLSSQSSSTSSASGATEIISLSGILSRLLSGLNSQTTKMKSSVQQSTATSALLQKQIQQASETTRRIWDLQLLLLRCAAIGRERTTFCTPTPHQYQRYGRHRTPEAIWNVSETICVAKLLQQSQSASSPKLSLEEQELMGYLMSLPWGKHCTLNNNKNNKNGGGIRRDFKSIEMTLDLQPALGDPSPRFRRLAAERGTTTVYHGTKMECTWSILNCGLWNFSETKFCKHGSLLGKGVYFSTNYKIAYQFAGNSTGGGGAGVGNNVSPARSFYKAWRHWSILRVLQLSNSSSNNNSIFLQDYDIVCFPVFEAQIISPPPPSSSFDDPSSSSTLEHDNKNNSSSPSISISATRKDGNYYVVPNSRDIRVTKLHLTFELVKKKSFPFFWFGIMLFCILAIRQASLVTSSSSTNTIKHHHRYQ